jgi:signal transduction histidine kinase
MLLKDLQLKNLLRLEVAYKSRQSSAAFAVFSIFIFFYCFGCTRFAWLIKASMVVIFIVSLIRLKIGKTINEKKYVSSRIWKLMVCLIWINAVCWSLAFNFASYELKLSGTHFIVVTTMLAGFISASLVTLAYDSILFLPFQFMLLLPQIGIIITLYMSPEKINALPLIFVYGMYFIYQMRQFKDFSSQLIQRLSYQLDLEQTNKELKISQEALIGQTTKLVHTSRLAALGEMSAGIAHEVNNPLAIISGSIQQIERIIKRGDSNPELLLNLSSKTLGSIDRVSKIINGLRHFSQQSDSNPRVVTSLKDIIEDTNNFCSELLAARQIKLQIDSIPDTKIECHPIHMSQVLINLIKNAEDALETEKRDEERFVRISFSENNEMVMIYVINGGEPIPKELQEKLFQPFFTTKPIGKGTGLGLSISHGLMREHNGDLVLDSSSLKTTFIMQLPAYKEACTMAPNLQTTY